MKKNTILSRRDFLKNASLAAGLLILPSSVLGREGAVSANSRLNVVGIGMGGQGRGDIKRIAQAGANIIGLCDPDTSQTAKLAEDFPKAETFRDYRKLFDKLGKEIDAVAIATPDHTHFNMAIHAMERGKHVYVQKPMAHTVEQCFKLRDAAEKHKVFTQMGNQGHSEDHIRVAKEWYEAGILGDVSEITTWTNRPGDWWPQGINEFQPADAPRGRRDADPANLDWDLWLGSAKEPAAYRPGIAHFNWRGYHAYGTGAIGDMAIHIFDPANYIFDLGAPTKVEVDLFGEKSPTITYPKRSKIIFHFPGNDKRGPIKVTWTDGLGSKPELPKGIESLADDGGSLLFGSKEVASIGAWGNFFNIAGTEEHFNELRKTAPARKYERIKGGHYKNWVDAIRNGDWSKQASSNFGYAAPFNAAVLIGSIAQRLGRTVEWDEKAGKFKNDPDADRLLRAPEPRAGWRA